MPSVQLPNGRTFVVDVDGDLATVFSDPLAFEDEAAELGHRRVRDHDSLEDLVVDVVGDEQPRLRCERVGITEAREGVARLHRHQPAVVGGLFALRCVRLDTGTTVGWAIVGRPNARMLQRRVARTQGYWHTVEVTRCATDGTPNACSALYGAACREAWTQGARGVVTYTRGDEPGSSLRGAGFERVVSTAGGTWAREDRPRADVDPGEKQRWVRRNPNPQPVGHLIQLHQDHVEDVLANAPDSAWPANADQLSDTELAEIITLHTEATP
jgi:hypothetical protein